jgi:sirohydrochlorin ferrochelatase
MNSTKGRIVKSMESKVVRLTCVAAAFAALLLVPVQQRVAASARQQAKAGILLLAHGGSAQWNENVRALAARVDTQQPTEVAFGMATRANIQAAADALVKRGVTEIVAVPLFVSSHSSVVTSTAYLLGLRAEAPADLAVFAKMSHGPAGHGPASATNHAGHAGHGGSDAPATDGTKPIALAVPVRMTPALDSHPIVAAILTDRARAISTNPAKEAVVLVAHGPVKDQENQLWLDNLATLAAGVKKDIAFASIDWMTVRDDAPAPIRDTATAELRALVTKRTAAGSRVLIVPVLLSFGGIEQGIRKRLDGLEYTMAAQALMPDDRLGAWIEAQLAR